MIANTKNIDFDQGIARSGIRPFSLQAESRGRVLPGSNVVALFKFM